MLTRLAYEFLKSRPYRKVTVSYRKIRIRAEVADTFAKQMVGLMYRDEIGEREGMLFPLSFNLRSAASIIMLNMKFSIDIVWLDRNRMVVDIFRNAKPSSSIFSRSYTPRSNARYVIELKAGSARKLGMKVGDRLAFQV